MASLRCVVLLFFAALNTFVPFVHGLGATDTITWGGDNSRSGYEINHNMDPAVVGGGDFGQIWRTLLPGNFNGIGPEQIFSQPLVYTLADGIQYIFVATTQNNIYKLDAKTGAIVASRNLHVPFLTADLDGCVDINPTIGVTGTGVIDPSTGYWYFTAKTYTSQFQNGQFSPQSTPGRLNGRYYLHAIDTKDLSEAPGFPTALEGAVFRNNPNRIMISGNQHQRPGLLQVGNFIYAGFASHCIQYNYTGAIFGFHKTSGNIVEAFATEGGPEPNTVPGGGVWMSGGGLAYDGKSSMFFSTGNGYASQLPATGKSVQGRNPPTSLEEAAVNMRIADDGTLAPVDFFMPWEKTQLDGGDRDLGTSPLQILPSDTFSCQNHRRIGVVTGKSGKTYWLNLDNLGGYQMGDNKQDAVIQVYQNENSVYAGAGVMPLSGGYIMINVVQFKTHVFKFSCDANGNAAFTKVSDSANKNAYVLGVGHGATTSLNGRDGTGLFWQTDVEGQNLRIYNAVPPSDGGNLMQLQGFNIPAVSKFSRPVFGNGRAYVGTTLGYLYAFGSPVNLPLNCTSPNVFLQTTIGNVSTRLSITCAALTQTTITGLNLTGNQNFMLYNLPATTLQLDAGATFTFQAAFAPRSVGVLSSDVVVNVTNSVGGFSSSVPITLTGTANSAAPLLAVTPNTASFNTIVGQGTSTQTIIFANTGDSLLTMTNISFSIISEKGPWISPNTTVNGSMQIGPFAFSGIPATIPGKSNAVVTIAYTPTAAANDAVYLVAYSDGGSKIAIIVGTGASQPAALFEFQSSDGKSWMPYSPAGFSFGDVYQGTTKSLNFRITNNGSATAAPLSLTVSKPPFGVPGIVGAVNSIDLAEGTLIAAGSSQNATLFCAVPQRQVNTPSFRGNATWTINTNDPSLGKKVVITFDCNAVAQQVGPLMANGSAQFPYLGCYADNTPDRQLATLLYDDDNMTNSRCIPACKAAGWKYAGTEYTRQCWCGNALPLQLGTDDDCNFRCDANSTEGCGGDGIQHNKAMLSLFVDANKFDGTRISPPLSIPKQVGSYQYKGCYKETTAKSFSQKSTASNIMTVDNCQTFCSGYALMGLQYASECWCGTTIDPSATLTLDSDCSMACKGNNSQYCGAGNRMQVYQFTQPSSSSAAQSSSTTSAAMTTSSSGSLSASSTANSITSSLASSSLTTTSSTTGSSATGFSVISSSTIGSSMAGSSTTGSSTNGVTTTGSTLSSATGILAVTSTSSTTVTSTAAIPSLSTSTTISPSTLGSSTIASPGLGFGSSTSSLVTLTTGTFSSTPLTTSSGISTMMTVSSVVSSTLLLSTTSSAFTSTGSSSGSAPSTAAMPTTTTTGTSSTSMSLTTSMPTSLTPVTVMSPSITVASSTTASSTTTVQPTPTTLSSARSSTSLTSASPSSQSTTTLATTTSIQTAAKTSTAPTTTTSSPSPPTIGPYIYLGCYTEVQGRALTAKQKYGSDVTNQVCASFCSGANYFATEYSAECYCGDVLASGSGATTDGRCNMRCANDTSQVCGGPNGLSLYRLNVTKTPPAVVPSASGYVSQGCYAEKPNGRALSVVYTNATAMTIPMCAAQALRNKYRWFGVEYGSECWMGSTLDASSTPLPQSKCGMLCPGDATSYCGAGNSLQLYNTSMVF